MTRILYALVAALSLALGGLTLVSADSGGLTQAAEPIMQGAPIFDDFSAVKKWCVNCDFDSVVQLTASDPSTVTFIDSKPMRIEVPNGFAIKSPGGFNLRYEAKYAFPGREESGSLPAGSGPRTFFDVTSVTFRLEIAWLTFDKVGSWCVSCPKDKPAFGQMNTKHPETIGLFTPEASMHVKVPADFGIAKSDGRFVLYFEAKYANKREEIGSIQFGTEKTFLDVKNISFTIERR